MLIDVLIATAGRGGVENIIKMMIDDLEGPDMHFRVIQLVWEGESWLPEDVPYYPLFKGKGDYSLDSFTDAYYGFLKLNSAPDMVLAAVWPYTVYVAKTALTRLMGRRDGFKVISWMHHEMSEYEKSYAGVRDWLAYADGHFAINDANYRTLRRLFPDAITYRLRNPIDIPAKNVIRQRRNAVRIRDNKIKLGFIGRISEEKNIELILKAVLNVKNCELTLVGSAENEKYEKSLKRMAEQTGISDRVKWLGWQSDPWPYVCDVDAICLTSLYEGFPLAALESLAHGIPVIASKTAGITEIIEEGVTGYTFDVGDTQAFEYIIESYFEKGGANLNPDECYKVALPYERHSVFWDMKIKLIAFALGEKLITDSDIVPWFLDEQLAKDKISFIIPCHNVEKYISDCLDSVLDQSINVADWEIICVDDASTDKTLDILKAYEQENEDRMMLIPLEKNVKQGGARNIGLSYASGNYITFVDSDDIVAPDMLDKLYRTMIKYGCKVVGSDHNRFECDDKPEFTGEHNFKPIIYNFTDKGIQKRYIIDRGWKTGVWARLYERAYLEENSINFPENMFMEDIYFSELVMMTVDKYVFIEEPLYGYRIHPNSTMFSSKIKYYYMHSFEMQCMVSKEIIKRDLLKDCRYEFQILHFSKAFIEEMCRMKEDPEFYSYENYHLMVKSLFEIFPDFMSNPYITQPAVAPYIKLINAADENELRLLLKE